MVPGPRDSPGRVRARPGAARLQSEAFTREPGTPVAVTKPCRSWGTMFVSPSHRHGFCSDRCREGALAARRAERRAARRADRTPKAPGPASCGRGGWARPELPATPGEAVGPARETAPNGSAATGQAVQENGAGAGVVPNRSVASPSGLEAQAFCGSELREPETAVGGPGSRCEVCFAAVEDGQSVCSAECRALAAKLTPPEPEEPPASQLRCGGRWR